MLLCQLSAPLQEKVLPQHLRLLLYCGSRHNYGHYYHYYYYYHHRCVSVVCVMLAVQLILLPACWEAGSGRFTCLGLVSDKGSALAVHDFQTPPQFSLWLAVSNVYVPCASWEPKVLFNATCVHKILIYSVTVLLVRRDTKHWVLHFRDCQQQHGGSHLQSTS